MKGYIKLTQKNTVFAIDETAHIRVPDNDNHPNQPLKISYCN